MDRFQWSDGVSWDELKDGCEEIAAERDEANRRAAEVILQRCRLEVRLEHARELARDLWWLVESLREEWDESLIRDMEERVKATPWMRREGE